VVLIDGKLANEFSKSRQEEILMEILIGFAVVGGLAVRLGYNRWWTWLLLAAGLGSATYSLIHFLQYLPKSAFLLAAGFAGVGAIIPDLGAALVQYLRRPRTISALLVVLVVAGIYFGAQRLGPNEQQQIGQAIGQFIVIAIMVFGIYTILSGPFRRKKKK